MTHYLFVSLSLTVVLSNEAMGTTRVAAVSVETAVAVLNETAVAIMMMMMMMKTQLLLLVPILVD